MARQDDRGDEMVVEFGRKTDGNASPEATPAPASDVPMGFLPQWVIREARADAWLYAAMASVTKAGAVSVTITQLAQLCNVSPRTVQNALAGLKKAGAIIAEPQHDDTGSRLPNLYHLCVEAPEVLKDAGSTAA
ncbi:HTH domain-containing protein [Streptomyces sp. NPDC051183]|uniref:HTH domain-containing protein n=1 Tax=Streptomyces sp. NPDC051183 TaxID=3155165 RepID=UPI003412E7F0